MSICNKVGELITECFKQSAMFLYKQPVVKNTVMSLCVMYDNYYNPEETVELLAGGEMEEPDFDLDDLLAGLECDLDLDDLKLE